MATYDIKDIIIYAKDLKLTININFINFIFFLYNRFVPTFKN